MDNLESAHVFCPSCGENIEIVVNIEDIGDSYIEDCQVCCAPITILVSLDEKGEVRVEAHNENEV